VRRREGVSRTVGCLLVPIVLFICLSITTVALNGVCQSGLRERLPIYPGAAVRSERYNFLVPFGVGQTIVTLYAPASQEDVRNFYGMATGSYIRRTNNTSNPIESIARYITRGQYDVSRAEDGEGTLVILFGSCVG
jgi:hypothetical protein